MLTSLNFGDDSFFYSKQVDIFGIHYLDIYILDLPSLDSIHFGSESFYFLESFSLDGNVYIICNT